MTVTADINPTEDEREQIRDLLQEACKNSQSRIDEMESFLKHNKKGVQEEQKKETEKDLVRYRRYSENLEDALNKCERTSGHTLKKAFNKKTMVAIRDTLTDQTQFNSLEKILQQNHLCNFDIVHPLNTCGSAKLYQCIVNPTGSANDMDGQRKVYVRATPPVKYKLSRNTGASGSQFRPAVVSSPSAPTVPGSYMAPRSPSPSSSCVVSGPHPGGKKLYHRPSLASMDSRGTSTESRSLSTVTAPVLVPPSVYGTTIKGEQSPERTSLDSPLASPMAIPPSVPPSISPSIPSAGSPPRCQSPAVAMPRVAPSCGVATDAVRARAQRKIMDLEISNTALLSINKYLEKRLKRQEKEYEHLQSYVQSGEFLEGIVFDESESEDDDDDDDDDNLDGGSHELNREDYSHADSIDEKTRKAREISNAHIEFLKQSDKTNRILQKCLLVTETLLKEAQTCLDKENGAPTQDEDDQLPAN